jgi:hypothetical protein
MNRLALLTAIGTAVLALAACSQAAPPSPAHVSHEADTHAPALVNCPREYETWKQGPGGKLTGTLGKVDAANTAGDMSSLRATLKQASSAVDKAARYPIPSCADPKGYWTALMMHVNAAAASVGSGSGTASMTLALKGVPKLQRELDAELKTTAGVN